MIVKKYGNRRLYDTDSSRYITLEELTDKIIDGAEARVVDAKSGEDLTPETLTQIIMSRRGGEALLPVKLLHQLIRLGDDALADFLGRYVQYALEFYLQAKTATTFMGYNPFILKTNPFVGKKDLSADAPYTFDPTPEPPSPAPASSAALAELRREVDELKRSLQKKRKRSGD